MGVSTSAPRDSNDLALRCIRHMLEDKAAREAIEEAVFKNMDIKVETGYSVTSMEMLVRVAWKNPYGGERRGVSMRVTDEAARDIGLFAQEVKYFMDNISLRGELYFFKLDRHFKGRIDKVACFPDGKVAVLFKNGHVVDGNEQDLDSKEFLATCAMVYDL